jgi:hypothetical protein
MNDDNHIADVLWEMEPNPGLRVLRKLIKVCDGEPAGKPEILDKALSEANVEIHVVIGAARDLKATEPEIRAFLNKLVTAVQSDEYQAFFDVKAAERLENDDHHTAGIWVREENVRRGETVLDSRTGASGLRYCKVQRSRRNPGTAQRLSA